MSIHFVAGGVLRFTTLDGVTSYAVMLNTRPYFAFYAEDAATSTRGSKIVFEGSPLFVVAVHNSAYSKGRWGGFPFRLSRAELPALPSFFRQNVLNPNDCEIVDSGGGSRQARPIECVGLERSAVWSAEHIESRISDLNAGHPNAFVDSLKVKL